MPQRSGHRHPTMPISKCDSESLSEFMRSRESLVALKETAEDSMESNNNKPIASPVPNKLHRTDSYKAATNKLNSISILDSGAQFRKTEYEKEKYKSLPVSSTVKPRTKKPGNLKRRSDHIIERNKVKRQESGVIPSPDTDEDQMSVVSERKKKSRFQKAKERILQTFQKQSKRDDEHRVKKREQGKIRTLKDNRNKIYRAKIESAEIIPDRCDTYPRSDHADLSQIRRHSSHSETTGKGSTRKVSDSQRPMTWAFTENESRDAPREKTGILSTVTSKTPESNDSVNRIFEKLLMSDLRPIKRESRSSSRKAHSENETGLMNSNSGRGDRSTLSLKLRSNRPRSFKYVSEERYEERKSSFGEKCQQQRYYSRQVSTYSDLDVDGHDDVDRGEQSMSVDLKSPLSDKGEFDNVPFEELPPEEKEKRVNDVANRLKLIAKRCVSRIESESGSEIESPMRDMRPGDFQLVEEIIAELRREGDRLSTQMDLQNNLTPLILQMSQQVTYRQFKNVVSTALRDSIGWDQIALYFYLTKTAVHVAGASTSIATMAVDYFKEKYSSWVKDRGGWESVIEATTTTDSELD